MTSPETQQIADALQAIAAKLTPPTYTITGAADWPILLALGGVVSFLLVVLIAVVGFMWKGLESSLKEWRKEMRGEMKEQINLLWVETRKITADFQKADAGIHQEMKECKEKCCE